ncbi:MAG: septum site-determining protein MinD [Thermococcaceae archaeon]|nr:septum site-determining protein MinD [Thermococcaceae archaeon]MDK2913504.1 septum site-determining protein MinD [Thermococcaceae archaeon]
MAVVGFMGNGGAGKTALVSNLGPLLARDGIRTLLLEGNLYFPDLGSYFGVRTSYTIYEFLQNPHMDIEWLLYNHPEIRDLYLIVGDVERLPDPRIHFWPLRSLIRTLKEYFGFILVDFPPGIPIESKPLADEIDYGVLVVELNSVPRRNWLQWLEELVNKYLITVHRKIFIVLNQAIMKGSERRVVESFIVEDLGIPLLGVLPYDESIVEGVFSGVPTSIFGEVREELLELAATFEEVFLLKRGLY